jgi:hypothetical protein
MSVHERICAVHGSGQIRQFIAKTGHLALTSIIGERAIEMTGTKPRTGHSISSRK